MWVEPIQQLLYEEMVERSGGMWVDQARGEVIVMLTAPAPDGESVAAASDKELLERLRAASQYPGAVVCMHATYTQVELEALVDDAMTRLNSPRSGSVDVVHNGVTIRLEIDEQTAHEVLGDLAEHPAVKVEVPECARVEEPPAGAVLLPGGGSNCYSRLAAASGTLGGDASAGCVWLEGDEGRRTPLAFPQGWSITSDGTIHNQLAEPVARLGDPVNAGGGYTEIELPEPCQTGHGAFQIGGMQPS